jgi:TolB-like protein/DNA-binding winged helix-turn-helix (wHTH) protein
LRFDDVEIDLEGFRLMKAGQLVQVEPKLLKVLIFLAESGGRLVGRQELIDALWGDAFVTDHVLNRAIGQLRKALGDDPKQPRYIETVPTLGYRFIGEIQSLGSEELPAEGEPLAASYPEDAPAAGAGPRIRSWRILRGGGVLVCVAVLVGGAVAFRMERARMAAATSVRSLAVLPLKNLSGDPSQDYVADGMTEELITDIGQISALTVISPTTALHYKDASKSPQEIAGELHVDAVVEGAMLRSGDQLRIDARLVDARSDRQLWSHSFEGSLRDAFALENQVASAVDLAGAQRTGQQPADQSGCVRRSAEGLLLRERQHARFPAEVAAVLYGFREAGPQLRPGLCGHRAQL